MSIGGGTRNRTCVRFPKRIAIEPASVRVFGLMSFFPRERYLLKGDADWVGERGSSRPVEPEFDSAFCNRTGVRKSRQPASQAKLTRCGCGVAPSKNTRLEKLGAMTNLHYYDQLYQFMVCLMSPNAIQDKKIMTLPELAEYLRLTERTIYRLAAKKQIPAFKVGGSWRFSLTDIDEWINEQSRSEHKRNTSNGAQENSR